MSRTATPAGTDAQPAGSPAASRTGGMGALVRAEFLKISSTRLWWGLLIGAVIWSMISAAATAGTAGMDQGGFGGPAPGLNDPEMLRTIYSMGFSGGYIFALILGITGMTGEYRYFTITASFLVSPKRWPIVVAKLVAHLVMGVVYGVVTAAAAVLVGAIVISIRGADIGLTADGVPRSILLSVVAVALWTLIGIGLGTLIRNQIAAILIGIALALIIEPVVTLLLSWADLGGVKYLPSQASAALLQQVPQGGDLLSWWAGGLLLVGYALAFAAIGVFSSLRRDIS